MSYSNPCPVNIVELLEKILGHLVDDKVSLGACARVSKFLWLDTSRAQLFSTLTVRADQFSTNFLPFLRSLNDDNVQPLSRYLRTLTLRNNDGDFDAPYGCLTYNVFQELMVRFPRIHTLKLQNIFLVSTEPSVQPTWSLRALELSNVFGPSRAPAQVIAFLRHFTSIEHLRMAEMNVVTNIGKTKDAVVPLKLPVRSITLGQTCGYVGVVSIAEKTINYSKTKSVLLSPTCASDVLSLGRLMSKTQNIQEACIDIREFETRDENFRGDPDKVWGELALATCRSLNTVQIALRVDVASNRSPDYEASLRTHWKALLNILSSLPRSVATVRVILSPPIVFADWKTVQQTRSFSSFVTQSVPDGFSRFSRRLREADWRTLEDKLSSTAHPELQEIAFLLQAQAQADDIDMDVLEKDFEMDEYLKRTIVGSLGCLRDGIAVTFPGSH